MAAPDRAGRNDGRAKIDRFTIDLNNTRLVAKLTAELRRSPREFTFVHLSLPDRAGHAHGFMGRVPGRCGADRSAPRPNPQHRGRPAPRSADIPLVLLTADHGGSGAAHYAADKLKNYRIPFMAWGPGVPAGRDLYALNPSFRSPGASRTELSREAADP